ncbi:hypothetical protein IU486_29445 [Streptomyces gardneri]|uniref:hypothetical protein n=1 Tax=Nocardia TaxID=1817 RepID=UPI0013591663|nr:MULTISPECIES: hypothetical protein [Nocardia]MBF6168835.1 hypothetical protein [Streptomyces gardneri]MBF6208671.1 hypothetical protein [Streptomyces gardneri]
MAGARLGYARCRRTKHTISPCRRQRHRPRLQHRRGRFAEHAIDVRADTATVSQEYAHAAVRLLAMQAPVAGKLQ